MKNRPRIAKIVDKSGEALVSHCSDNDDVPTAPGRDAHEAELLGTDTPPDAIARDAKEADLLGQLGIVQKPTGAGR